MKKIIRYVTMLVFIFLVCGCSSFQYPDAQEYFFDDFDGDKLDGTKWARCPEWERQTGMENHGWWSDSCSYVKDGNLVIECKKDKDGRLISGGIRSISKDYSNVMFKGSQGIYEIKFKAEKGSGFWYAFWLLANNDDAHIGNGAKDGAEIDCFELLPGASWWNYKGKNQKIEDRFMTTVHWDGYGSAHKSKGTDGIKLTDFDSEFYDNWHIYKFIWNEDSYTCYLDDTFLWSMNGADYGGICTVPGYLKITAEFGEWGGEVDSVINEGGSRKLLVDYVKYSRFLDE